MQNITARVLRDSEANTPQRVTLDLNPPLGVEGLVIRFTSNGLIPDFNKWRHPATPFRLFKSQVQPGQPRRWLFIPYNTALAIWYIDAWEYDGNTPAMNFKQAGAVDLEKTHYLSGTCELDGTPFAGTVRIIEVDATTHLGTVQANPSTGQWRFEVSASAPVLAVVSVDYGVEYAEGVQAGSGSIIHPPAANGYVYEVLTAGTLGPPPAEWPTSETLPTGTAILSPKPYPAPVVHGPIYPEPL